MQTPARTQPALVPSRRSRSGDDPIFALHREATARKAAGEDIINGTLGALLDDAGELLVLPTAARAVQEVGTNDWAAYAPIAGTPAFLEAVLRDVFGADDEAIGASVAVATPGGTGALRHGITSFLEPGDALLTTDFFWGPYRTLADENERRVRTFRMFDDALAFDGAALDAALGQTLAAQGRALLILNDPCHNPTGYSMTEAEWHEVARIVERHAVEHPVAVLLDNAYAAYGPPGAMGTALAALKRLAHVATVLVAWSASKTFTHYGLRVGALVALVPDPAERGLVQAALTHACRGTWSNTNRGGLTAITRLLVEPDLRRAVDAERAAAVALLARRVDTFNGAARAAGLRHPRYDGGFFSTVLTADAPAAAERLRAAGVYVVPIRGALRLGLCAIATADVARTVAAVGKALAAG